MVETPPPDTLNGWKEIAAYVGKSVRSVQRWETTMGLPVHRIRTPDGQIVYSLRGEIDEWRRTLDAPLPDSVEDSDRQRWLEIRRRARPWVAAAAIALTFVAGTLFGRWQSRVIPIPATIEVQGRAVQAFDRNGRTVWTHALGWESSFTRDTFGGVMTALPVDLDDDGVPEIIVPVRRVEERGKLSTSDEILAFRQDGRLLWRVSPDVSVTYGAETFSAPWRMEMFAPSNTTPRRVFAAFSHHTWWPAVVIEIAADGSHRPIHWQNSRVIRLAHWQTPAGSMLAMGGVSHQGRPMLALWPDGGPPTSLTTGTAVGDQCTSCPTAQPYRTFLFDRSDLAPAFPEWHPAVSTLTVRGVDLSVRVREGGDQGVQGHSTWVLRPDLTIGQWAYSDSYWAAHDHFHRLGRLSHAADRCPVRQQPRTVEVWSVSGRSPVMLAPAPIGS